MLLVSQTGIRQTEINLVIDTSTGVHYLQTYQGGICPRYGGDGKPVVSSKEELDRLIQRKQAGEALYI